MSTNSIEICDNYNQYVSKSLAWGPFEIKENIGKKGDASKVIKDLDLISGKSLTTLKEEDPNLLIFPEDLGVIQDGLNDQEKFICSLYPAYDKKYLETGNVMGWIGCGNTQLKIYSRFDSDLYDVLNDLNSENTPQENTDSKKKKQNRPKIKPKNDFFIYYILSKLGAFRLTSLDYTKGEGNTLNNLLGLMFPAFLKNAVSQGLYKEYRTFERNDSNVRGVIDINRHIRHNNPFMGKVAYRTREFSFDNDITQLIRHTIEYLEETPMGANILGGDAETRQCADVIRQATPTYNEKERGMIINNNLRPKMHPYYTDYISLQKLCMQILHEEGINYGVNSEEKVHGILFDGAWLWEAYIFTLLNESGLGFEHADNIAKTNRFNLFSTREDEENQFDKGNRSAYPDFYNDESKCVLDAKYKHLEKCVQREDLYQVITYMHTMKYSKGGFIYPYQDSTQTKIDVKEKKPQKLAGLGGLIATIPFVIPNYPNNIEQQKIDAEWEIFCESMETAERYFKINIQKFLNTETSEDLAWDSMT